MVGLVTRDMRMRVKIQLDLAWYDNTMKNQDVTWTGPVECLVLLTTV
jgi:hypothetical protein